MSALFTIRDARPDDMDAINAYAANEGMDELPSWHIFIFFLSRLIL